jgi:hypothetical protein
MRKALTIPGLMVLGLLFFACAWENRADDTHGTPKIDTSRLHSAYVRALEVRDKMDKTSTLYGTLLNAITATENFLASPALYGTYTAASQTSVDTQTATLITLLELIDPTPKPPEVTG